MSFLAKLSAIIDEETFGFGAESPTVTPLTGEIAVVAHRHLLPLPRALGKIMVQAGLYSKDGDFTHQWTQKAGHENRSWLQQVWTGRIDSHHTGARFWTLLNGENPIGVALLETSDSTETVGRRTWVEAGALSVYLLPAYRGRGLMKKVMEDHVAPFIGKQAADAARMGAGLFAGAEDAAGTLLVHCLTHAGVDCTVLPVHHAGPLRTRMLDGLSPRKPFSP